VGIAPQNPSRPSSPSCIYIDADPFSWTHFAGIPRYTARLTLALAARIPVRFFHQADELLPPRGLGWSQDQDLEDWGRRIFRGQRRPLGEPPADCIGLHCSTRTGRRIFPYEVSILHDFCPMVVPWAFPERARDGWVRYLSEDIEASDLVVAVSHSTKADAAWFSPLDPERILVAPSGPSLCVELHGHRGPVVRSDRVGLVVSTIEPRKNMAFLFDWFHHTRLLPPDMELWCVGKLGWKISRDEIERIAYRPGGRRVRLLGNVSDHRLCELYQTAGWSIYPSKYEGFGFPILDSLRHGTPVLASHTSSMGEFDHAGVHFFDPDDPATVDRAWERLQAAATGPVARDRLDALYSWDLVAKALLDAHARDHAGGAADRGRPRPTEFSGDGSARAGGCPVPMATPGPGPGVGVFSRAERGDRVRIGIEVFGTQTGSRLRGIGRYSRNLLAALLARDAVNDYVLYAQEGLPTAQIPTAPNAVVRLVRPESARGETTLAQVMERLAETNPDGLDVLLLLNPLEMAVGFDLPARPLGGLKMAAVVYDLIPLVQEEETFDVWGERIARRYLQGLDRLRSYDVLLAISESTRRDVVSFLKLSPDRVVAVGAASDGRFFVPDHAEPMPAESRALLHALGITRPFVYSVGSLEYRKNLWGLIDAFAMLPERLRRAHQLVLTYALPEVDQGRVRRYAWERGIADPLVLTDRLGDRALRILYQRCAAFVFPSFYEGFGLPILEAMHCGAPVIAGNNSSQIEVVGDAALLFNPADAGELAAQLVRVLDDPGRAHELGERAVVQARRFRWDETAGKALDVLTQLRAVGPSVHRRPARRPTPRRRIAFFSPLPPLRSGVSDYAARLLNELKRRYVIDLYHDLGYVPHMALGAHDLACYDYRLFERNARALGYHAVVYQVGNSPYHAYMYDTLLRHPGIVTLHELNLVNLHFEYARRPGVDGMAHLGRELEAFCGAGAAEELRAAAEAPGDLQRACTERGYYLNARVFERASAVIVHSPWCLERVRDMLPDHLGKTFVVGMGATAQDPSPQQRLAIRARLKVPPEALIIASLGWLHETKMNVETIAAFASLVDAIPEALLLFVGGEYDGGAARHKVMELGLQHRVRFLGHYPDDLADLAAIADIGVCLRQPPTNGETSASLMDLLRLGVPTIVSDVGSFSCYPDSVVRKHRMDAEGIAGLAQALRELAEDRPHREALGRSAWHYIRHNHTWSGAADAYGEIIERAVAGHACPRNVEDLAPLRPRAVTSPEWLRPAS
jgi:glycosyltransferase involved in cell wall biosynthesis